MLNLLIKKTLVNVVLFTLVLVTVVFSVFFYDPNTPDTDNNFDCNISSQPCDLTLGDTLLSVKFLQTPVSEEELFLEFKVSDDIFIKEAWIEGVSMYMGKTPVIFDTAKDKAVTFLGSCNLKTMEWRLLIRTANKKGDTEKISSVAFFTYLK